LIRRFLARRSAFPTPQFEYHRPHRHLHDLRWRTAAMHLFPLPVSAIFRSDQRLVKQTGESVGMLVGPQDDVASAAAVATVRPAARDKLFPSEAHTAASAIAGLGMHFDSVNEHRCSIHPAAHNDSA